MTRALADTSLLIALETGRALSDMPLPDQLAVSIITIGELRAGVLAATDLSVRDRRLITLSTASTLDPLPIDGEVAESWARLRIALRDAGRRMPVNDSWIAATAIAHGIPVVSQDDDYDDAPGLEVIKV